MSWKYDSCSSGASFNEWHAHHVEQRRHDSSEHSGYLNGGGSGGSSHPHLSKIPCKRDRHLTCNPYPDLGYHEECQFVKCMDIYHKDDDVFWSEYEDVKGDGYPRRTKYCRDYDCKKHKQE